MSNLREFAEKISPYPLSKLQKQFLDAYEKAEERGCRFYCIFPCRYGRQMMLDIIREFKHSK